MRASGQSGEWGENAERLFDIDQSRRSEHDLSVLTGLLAQISAIDLDRARKVLYY